MRSIAIVVLGTIGIWVSANPVVEAQTWSQTAAGTTYSWTTTGNWTNATVPNGIDASASLTNNIAGNQTISLSSTVTLGSLAIGDSDGQQAFTLQNGSGGSLVFDVSSGSATINRTSGSSADTIAATVTLADNLAITSAVNTLTLSGAIGETGGARALTKAGAGTLTLSGSTANTYTGLTTVSGGVLTLGKTSGNAFGGNLSINNASVSWSGTGNTDLIPDTASVTITGSNSNLNWDRSIPGQTALGTSETFANLTMDGGIFWMGGNTSSVWAITGTASFTGGSGNTQFGNSSGGRISFGALQLTNMTGTSVGTANTFGANGGNTTSVTVGAGGLTLNNSNVVLRIQNVGARLVLNGGLTTTGGSSSSVVGNVQNGDLTGGVVAIELSGTTGNVTRTFTIGGGGADFTSFVPITNGSATSAGITKAGAGTLTLSASNSYNGTTTINAGTLLVNNANALAGSGSVTFGGGVLRYSSNNAVDYAAKIVGSGSAIAINTNGRSVTFGSALASTNTGGLTKSGSGSLSLNAANLYSGATTISAGTLALGGSGSFDSSPTITIGDAGSSGAVLDLTAKSSGFTFLSGQTVKGIGTIQLASGKTLTINGTLAAGNSPGTLTVAGGDLVLGGSSITSYEISGTNNTVGGGINDLTTVSGSLTLGGTLNVIASPAFDVFGNRTYRVFNYATSGTGSLAGGMTMGTTPDANYLYSLDTATSGQVNLFVQRRADQASTFSMTTGTVTRALVNTTVSLTGSVSNSSPVGSASLTLGLSSTGQLSVTGFTTGSLAGLSGTAVAGTINTGNTVGSRTWTMVNTDASAIMTTSTATGSLTVVNQRSFTAESGTIALGTFLRTLGTSGTTTISSSGSYATTASATLDGFTGTNTKGFGLALATGTNVFDGGSAFQQAVYSLTGSATSAGVINGSFSSNVTAEIGSIAPVGVLLTGTALDPALASFTSGSPTTTWLIDFGSLTQGSGTQSLGFNLFNLSQMPGYTADLALLSITSGTGNTTTIGTNLVEFNSLTAGTSSPWLASISTANVGSFTNTYTLSFKSANNGTVFSGDTQQSLNLTVTGIIVVPEPGACALAAIGIAAVTWRLSRRRCRHSS